MDCRSAQQALDGRAIDPAVQTHVDICAACAVERRVAVALRAATVIEAPADLSVRLMALAQPAPRATRLDVALQRSVVLEAPPDLTRRLAALVPGQAAVVPARPRWMMTVYGLTAVLLGVLLIAASQVYGVSLQPLGIGDLVRAAAQVPMTWLDQLYAVFPQGRYVVDAFFSLQQALQWVLAGLLMWAVLEMRMPRRARAAARG